MAAEPPRLGHFFKLYLHTVDQPFCSVFNELSLPMSHFERQSIRLITATYMLSLRNANAGDFSEQCRFAANEEKLLNCSS